MNIRLSFGARLLCAAVIVAAIAFGALMIAADYLAKYIPFRDEADLARQFDSSLPPPSDVADYLQSIADRLVVAQSLPEPVRAAVSAAKRK